MSEAGNLRVGIDVGGTFTDVVAVDAATRAIVARVKVPTTHDASGGVAAGIVTGLERLLAQPGIDAARVAFIAHSTTQATNALLEGDLATVGVVGLHGRFDWLARRLARLPALALGQGAPFAPATVFARADDERAIERAVDALVASGVDAIAASEPFGVDRPEAERRTATYARARGVAATAGHEVSSGYGLRARTRTAALNAAVLPRMLSTARTTADAGRAAGIGVPLMIMRSDGGVMDVGELAHRPILTLLSGPAAGIAGALLHENVTDGIFIEVGGTSADCSVIRRGRPEMRPARIGGHRTLLRTLDVRTLAVAGGSLCRIAPGTHGIAALTGVGPRSAHIAGLGYVAFAPDDALREARIVLVPAADGASARDSFLALEATDGSRFAFTPTCAANFLDIVPPGDFARGNAASTAHGFALAADHLGCEPRAFAEAVLAYTAAALRATIDELIADYALERAHVELVGGGGGAAALVPFAARRLGFSYRLARDAEVISPLGVALALVRDVVERTIVAATPEDVVRVRREAFERVVAAGAAPELVEVTLEIDPRRNLVRATASGATAAVAGASGARTASDAERREAAARSARCAPDALVDLLACGSFELYGSAGTAVVCAVDARGVVRLVARDARVVHTTVARLSRDLERALEEATAFGDVGRALPDVHVLYGERVADFGGLADAAAVCALAAEEIRGLEPDVALALIIAKRRA